MKMATAIKNLFKGGKKDSDIRYVMKASEELIESDYGMNNIRIVLMSSNDYGWKKPKKLSKKYILMDIESCKEISALDLVDAWKETGHVEWECLLAGVFFSVLMEAWNSGKSEADISSLFNHSLIAKNKTLENDELTKILLKFFTVEKKKIGKIYLKLNIAATA